MKSFEDMKALAVLCEEAGEEKHKQIIAIMELMDLTMTNAHALWTDLYVAGMVKGK